ncbi:MAG: tetraacyldisaccharide 4'-kinase [candidate division WOR-3 bacterium]
MLKAFFSNIYRLGLNIWYFYDENFRIKDVLPAKVISIGNLTVGGTGKTPLTIHLAQKLSENYRLAILTRGYKRKSSGILLLHGSQPLITWKNTGDEPYLMWKKLGGEIPVVIGKNRYETGKLAIKQFNVNMLLLDDGFQYLPLKRDVDILCINQETIIKGDYLLPRGKLREDFSAIRRAHIIILNLKGEPLNRKSLEYLETWKKPVFVMKYKPIRFYNFEGQQFSLTSLKGFDVAVLTGIADPQSFLTIIRNLGVDPKETILIKDHDAYPLTKLRYLTQKYDYIITTEKDLIKYPIQKKMLALEIDVEIENEKELLKLL